MEYIKKSIVIDSGVAVENWVVTGIWIDVKAALAVIYLDGYYSLDKNSIVKKEVSITTIEALSIYSSMHDVVVNVIQNSTEFLNAELMQG